MTKNGLFEFSSQPDTLDLCSSVLTTSPDARLENIYTLQPNPATNQVRINWLQTPPADLKFRLLNLHGVEVMRWSAEEQHPVSVAALPNGLYFIQPVSVKGGLPVKKLLITH